MTTPHHWQDARLKKALDNAPDLQATPSATTRNKILKAAADALVKPKSNSSSWWKNILRQLIEKSHFSRNAGFATAIVIICVGVIWTLNNPMNAIDSLVTHNTPPTPVATPPLPRSAPPATETIATQTQLTGHISASSTQAHEIVPDTLQQASTVTPSTTREEQAHLQPVQSPIQQLPTEPTSSTIERQRNHANTPLLQTPPPAPTTNAEPAVQIDEKETRRSPSFEVANSSSGDHTDYVAHDLYSETSIASDSDSGSAPVPQTARGSAAQFEIHTPSTAQTQTHTQTRIDSAETFRQTRNHNSGKLQQNTGNTASTLSTRNHLPGSQILSGNTSTSIPAPVAAQEQMITAVTENTANEVPETYAISNSSTQAEEITPPSAMFDVTPSTQSNQQPQNNTDYKTLIHAIYAWNQLYLSSSYGTTIIDRKSATELQNRLVNIISHAQKSPHTINNNQSAWLLTLYQNLTFLGTITIQGQNWTFSTTHPCMLDCKIPESSSLGGTLNQQDAQALEQSINNLIP